MLKDTDDQKRFMLALLLSLGLAMVYTLVNQQFRQDGNIGEETEQVSQEESKDADKGEADKPDRSKTTTGDAERSEKEGQDEEEPSEETDEEESSSDVPEQPDDDKEKDRKEKEQPEPASEKVPKRKVTLENSEIKAVFTNRGATLKSLTLKNYYQTASEEEKVRLVNDRYQHPPSFDVKSNEPEQVDVEFSLNTVNWKTKNEEKDENSVTFVTRHRSGLIIEKTFRLSEENPHMLGVNFTMRAGKKPVEVGQLRLHSTAGIVLQSRQDESYHQAVRGYKDEGEWTYANLSISDVAERNEPYEMNDPAWAGVINKYFGNIMIPESRNGGLLGYGFKKIVEEGNENGPFADRKKGEGIIPDHSVSAYFITERINLDPNSSKNFRFQLFSGPKKEKLLDQYSDIGLPNLIDFGWFGVISRLFMSILGFFYDLIGNYGVAILLLTFIVKLCLHPLTRKAHISMHKMKELQPKIEELREKYEDDRQKLGEKQMELFKEHGVNPLGGCLPMVFQMPVLIGLYYGIRISFEVRQKPFVGWITDLSQPDKFMEIGLGTIFGLNFQYLNLLIVLMMVTWMSSALLQPTPSGGTGSSQAKMMKFMPMVIGILFYNFPSGLVLYWMVSTMFSSLEQLYIRGVLLND